MNRLLRAVCLASMAVPAASCASRAAAPAVPIAVAAYGAPWYDPANNSRAEPPTSWRADAPNGGFWINVFISRDASGNPEGYRFELFPSQWPFGRAYFVSSTLIPIEPGVVFEWRDNSTVVVSASDGEYMTISAGELEWTSTGRPHTKAAPAESAVRRPYRDLSPE